MQNIFISIIIITVYISIIIEIVFFSVPSVASTNQLFTPDKTKTEIAGLLGRVRKFSSAKKFMVLCVADFLGMTAFFIPLVLTFSPGLNAYLVPVSFPGQEFLSVAGVLLLIAGRAISLSAIPKIKGRNGKINTDVSLITQGIFTFSRNPIALGMILTFLGLFFIVPSLILFIGFLIFVTNMHFRILMEEDFMRSRFGIRYDKYLLRVRRYL